MGVWNIIYGKVRIWFRYRYLLLRFSSLYASVRYVWQWWHVVGVISSWPACPWSTIWMRGGEQRPSFYSMGKLCSAPGPLSGWGEENRDHPWSIIWTRWGEQRPIFSSMGKLYMLFQHDDVRVDDSHTGRSRPDEHSHQTWPSGH